MRRSRPPEGPASSQAAPSSAGPPVSSSSAAPTARRSQQGRRSGGSSSLSNEGRAAAGPDGDSGGDAPDGPAAPSWCCGTLSRAYGRTPLPSLLRLLVRADFAALSVVRRCRLCLPLPLRAALSALTSSHPLHDISSGVWLGALVAVLFVGWEMAWMLVANLSLALLLSWTLAAPGPGDLDPVGYRLRRGRVSPAGFPCLELHMLTVVVVMLNVAYEKGGDGGGGGGADASAAVAPTGLGVGLGASLGAGVVLLLFLLRLFALTHFVSQLLGACVLARAWRVGGTSFSCFRGF